MEQKLPVILSGASSAPLKNPPPNRATYCFEGPIFSVAVA